MQPADSKALLLIMLRSQKPITLTAGKFMDMSLNNYGRVSTFDSISNSTFYSGIIYNFLKLFFIKTFIIFHFLSEILNASASYLSVLRALSDKKK